MRLLLFVGANFASENTKTDSTCELSFTLSEEFKKSPTSSSRYFANLSALKNYSKNTYSLINKQRLSVERAHCTPMARNSSKYREDYESSSCFRTFLGGKSILGKSHSGEKNSQPKPPHKVPKLAQERAKNTRAPLKSHKKLVERKKSPLKEPNKNDKSLPFLPSINSRPAKSILYSINSRKE